jgi:hypothetical protein
VLKPGGRCAVNAEFYNGGRHARYDSRLTQFTGMAVLNIEQHRSLFQGAGFNDVKIIEVAARG